MTVVRGFVITLASGLGFAACGCAAGYALAVVAPDYYRTMFQIPTAAEINVRHLGLALGLTQGFATGLESRSHARRRCRDDTVALWHSGLSSNVPDRHRVVDSRSGPRARIAPNAGPWVGSMARAA